MDIVPGEDTFDLIVLSEVLEHIEDPASVMRRLRDLVAPGGHVFVNTPLNSPSPDHIYLMEQPEDARRLLTETGFEIVEEGMFATQGAPLDKALRNRVSVSVAMFGRPG
jgi:2-polyprenyl-3-methyl-5-hydroxy-6-metoxy-1,4-benzoquinol methylase